MDNTAIDREALEDKLHDPTASPIPLPFEFLKDITCNFSEEQELGRGGYGVVYKGLLRNGDIIAVKKLLEINYDEFQKEVTNLIGIKHQNIVQLVGYCAESSSEAMKLPSGIYVLVEIPRSLLCFEYLGNKSLDKHVSDESCGLDWNKRYQIIKGICSGLHFLHGECHMVHLDLKPENILMDDTMMPKIADFGLSKLFGAQKSRTIVSTGNRPGTLGYMAPEYNFQGIISPKADIFSFGVIIIEIITGVREYPMCAVLSFQEVNENGSCQSTAKSLKKYRENVIGRWRDVFKREPKHTSLEIYTEQVEQCITIALECLKDSTRRPTACDISQMLTGQICSCQKKKLLWAQPMSLRFRFTENHVVTSCPIELTNSTDDTVAFRMVVNDQEKYFPWPVHGLVLPRSICTLRVPLCRPLEDVNRLTNKLECTASSQKPAFNCTYYIRRSDEQNELLDVQASDSDKYNRIFAEAKNKGRQVQQMNLLFVIAYEPGNVISRYELDSSIHDILVHPTKTWIIMITLGGWYEDVWYEEFNIKIWDYQDQERVDTSDELMDRLLYSTAAILVPRMQWSVVGKSNGRIIVYGYETWEEVKFFQAHEKAVSLLDIHPTEPYVLSSSYLDGTVKLWNWEDWECVWKVEMDIRFTKFNPNDADSIACATHKGVKVWNIASPLSAFCIGSSTVITFEFLTSGDESYLITGHYDGLVKIWDWRRRSCLKTLKGSTEDAVNTICAHPNLPIVITGSRDGTVCLWNSITFEFEGKLNYGLGSVNAIACFKGSNRIAIGHSKGLVIAEI